MLITNLITDLLDGKQTVVDEAKTLIQQTYLADTRPWVVGFSGGKDSTVVVQLLFEALSELPEESRTKPVYVISSDTLVENPLVMATVDLALNQIQTAAREQGLPVEAHKVRPDIEKSFWVNLIGRGYPSPTPTFRWCTDRLKIDPANRFIMDKVSEHGEVIVVLGVREDESKARGDSIRLHSIEGTDLMRHTTLHNAFTFAPIRNFSTEDVWDYLLGTPSPWGGDNHELNRMYRDSSGGDCPLVIDPGMKKSGSCGSSRFGCWTCTVVSKDKSLNGFIQSGSDWLRPLLEFRNWLVEIRSDRKMRQKCRTGGRIYLIKNPGVNPNTPRVVYERLDDYLDAVDLRTIEEDIIIEKDEGLLFPEEYVLGLGPFTLRARRKILRRLLNVQRVVRKSGHDIRLIQPDEIAMIQSIWKAEAKNIA
ncbi:MAG: DNA phosphorothioation system sulfurtransferase DndC [Firmicutes bacterium]|uniref:Phosphoadenosine phosphosulphate reductase domain-containing protein n=1 Tax=Kroppenstedtia guangzhouensis TaxID=1274356 RepID=A0ABQ1GMU0_9BACL|nr:DNA phosphorothioation system sulfurtransferase DndC [Kroppenstedtia guangzhouensis]EGK10212.1 phosphoadenosine phosphosulfate reductase [Desmospora sp. 8437]MDA8353642.1 DNA phosphorothioation system sulfurtransferase DndC [Bacillota bacterium]GGA46983.1 hypothetical protein GCM10007416_20210 [Kroppenstedtia guangzhouensis]